MDREALQIKLLDWGANDVGFADIGQFDMLHYPRAISICVRLLDSVIDEIEYEPTYTYYAHYKTVNALLDQLILKTATEIEKTGYAAYPIAASQSIGNRSDYRAVFSHKAAATLAGLGSIGKNGLFYTIHSVLVFAWGQYLPICRLRVGKPLHDRYAVHAGSAWKNVPPAHCTDAIGNRTRSEKKFTIRKFAVNLCQIIFQTSAEDLFAVFVWLSVRKVKNRSVTLYYPRRIKDEIYQN